MPAEKNFTCLDCPALAYFDSEIQTTLQLKSTALDESLAGMATFEQASKAGFTSDAAEYAKLLAAWRAKSEEIFVALEETETVLTDTRSQVLETCKDNRPKVVRESWLSSRRMLSCGSHLAHQILKHEAITPLTDS